MGKNTSTTKSLFIFSFHVKKRIFNAMWSVSWLFISTVLLRNNVSTLFTQMLYANYIYILKNYHNFIFLAVTQLHLGKQRWEICGQKELEFARMVSHKSMVIRCMENCTDHIKAAVMGEENANASCNPLCVTFVFFGSYCAMCYTGMVCHNL